MFDWLVERVPAPTRMLGVGSNGSEGDVNGAGNGRSEASLATKEQEAQVD